MATSPRLGGTDSLMRTIEVDPVLRSPILAVGLCSRAPDWQRILEIAEQAVDAFPALRSRVVGRRWVDAPGFRVSDHVRRIRLAEDGSLRSLLDFAEPTVTVAFDPARPPWEWTVIEGLEDGRAGFAFRLHHTLTDGVGGIALAASLLFESEQPVPADSAPAPGGGVGARAGRRPPGSGCPAVGLAPA